MRQQSVLDDNEACWRRRHPRHRTGFDEMIYVAYRLVVEESERRSAAKEAIKAPENKK
jgi:hypothetical protein